MDSFTTVNEGNFEQEVLKSSLPVLLEFGAGWCGPCRMLEPVLDQLAAVWQGKLRMAKVDIDQNVNLTMQFQILGVPTLLLFKDGQVVQRLNGYQPRDRITEKLQPFLEG